MKTSLIKLKIGLASAVFLAAAMGYAQVPIYTITFNSDADATAFNTETQGGATASFVPGDAPSGQALSTGSLLMTMPAGGSWYYVAEYFPSTVDLSGADTFSLWYKIVQGNTSGGINSLQPIIKDNNNNWDQSSLNPGISGTTWTQFTMPMANFTSVPVSSLTAAKGYIQSIWDGSVGPNGLQLEICNIQWSAPIPEPSSLALFGFGAVAFGLVCRIRRKTS